LSEQTHGHQEQDSEAFAHQLATKGLQMEADRRQAMRRKVEGRAQAKKDEQSGKVLMEDGQLVEPLAAYLQSAAVDFSHIPDEFIKSNKYGKFKVRWVRKLDDWGDPSDTEIGYHERFGFEVIKGKGGDPKKAFERREFIAMQGSAEGFAALLAHSAKPGSSVYDQAFEQFDDLVERTNKKAGYRAVEPFTAPDHGPEAPGRVTINV
jgi:hypothetical protein